jgi:hypothetical protein
MKLIVHTSSKPLLCFHVSLLAMNATIKLLKVKKLQSKRLKLRTLDVHVSIQSETNAEKESCNNTRKCTDH